jgi:hypothetical protein
MTERFYSWIAAVYMYTHYRDEVQRLMDESAKIGDYILRVG